MFVSFCPSSISAQYLLFFRSSPTLLLPPLNKRRLMMNVARLRTEQLLGVAGREGGRGVPELLLCCFFPKILYVEEDEEKEEGEKDDVSRLCRSNNEVSKWQRNYDEKDGAL